MIWEIGTVAKQVLLPPLGAVWLVVLAWFVLRRHPGAARWLLFAFLAFTYLLSLPSVAVYLTRLVELPSVEARFAQGQAIVVVGGGRRLVYDATGNIVDAYPGPFALERIVAGARLARTTGLPVLVTSGTPDGHEPTEAVVMRDVLARDFDVPVAWMEAESRNTVENAQLTARKLLPLGIKTIVLVTSAFHMRRAAMLFERSGFTVLPAAVNPISRSPTEPTSAADFVPSASGLMRSYYAFNEIVGIAYGWIVTDETQSATVGN